MAEYDQPIPTFDAHMESLVSATYEEARTKPNSKVASAEHFEEMKHHLLDLYDGVTPVHSFMGDSGLVYDCIPIEQQASLRKSGEDIGPVPRPPNGAEAKPIERPERKDKFGNPISCPSGTIAMRRITIDEVTRHETLRHFHAKHRGGMGGHPRLSQSDPESSVGLSVHQYAHGYQSVENMGGGNTMSVANPATQPGQMSLSQHWYSGGSGSKLQTCEVGWQVQEALFHDLDPHIFVYWTADNYQSTGSYNTDAGHFVQVNHKFVFGEALAKEDFNIQVLFRSDRWWIWLDNVALGYYPASLYGTGVLSTKATDVDWGGETAGQNNVWPPMGTGEFPPRPDTAVQYYCTYYKFINSTTKVGAATFANLTAKETHPNFYKISLLSPHNFQFGGPGGMVAGNINKIGYIAGDNEYGVLIWANQHVRYTKSNSDPSWVKLKTPPFEPKGMCGDNFLGPIIYNGCKVAYMNNLIKNEWHQTADAPFLIEGIAGGNSHGPYIIGGGKLAYMYSYDENKWHIAGKGNSVVTAPPIPPIGIANHNQQKEFGPIIFNGTDVRYFPVTSLSSGWQKLPSAPFSVQGIAAGNLGGPIIYNGRQVAYLNNFDVPKWQKTADAPFVIKGITGENAHGIIVYNGSKIVLNGDYTINKWKKIKYP